MEDITRIEEWTGSAKRTLKIQKRRKTHGEEGASGKKTNILLVYDGKEL